MKLKTWQGRDINFPSVPHKMTAKVALSNVNYWQRSIEFASETQLSQLEFECKVFDDSCFDRICDTISALCG
jgi:hypothetical protein